MFFLFFFEKFDFDGAFLIDFNKDSRGDFLAFLLDFLSISLEHFEFAIDFIARATAFLDEILKDTLRTPFKLKQTWLDNLLRLIVVFSEELRFHRVHEINDLILLSNN